MHLVEYNDDLSHLNTITDLHGIGWWSIEEQMADLEPTDILEEVKGSETLYTVTFLHGLI